MEGKERKEGKVGEGNEGERGNILAEEQKAGLTIT